MNVYVPSTPDPQTVTLVASLLRHILTILSGVGLSVGVYSDSALTVIAGAIVGVATVGWALYQKFAAARDDHEGSVESAKMAQPVKATS